MPLSRSRDYLSIGEVLDTLRPEFEDISISKIRFLESEGLISPERTASGYRKFFESDVARLRYILSLQRDHFLPLKVIRERLDQADREGRYPETPGASRAPVEDDRASSGARSERDGELIGAQLSREELLNAAGLSEEQLAGLEDFGVLGKRNGDFYDENDLLLAKAAQKFFSYGVEPRHLRMYRQFAEREAAFFEQIVTPVLRKRDAAGAERATQSVRELIALSRQLREAALRSSLRGLVTRS